MTSNTQPAPRTETTIQDLAKAYGNQIVRRDNKFYDIGHLGTPLSRNDVEMMVLNRIREEHPQAQLSNEVLKGLFKLLIETRHTDTERAFQVWNGTTVSEPGNANRLISSRGAVSANVWSEPEYRRARVNAADLGNHTAYALPFPNKGTASSQRTLPAEAAPSLNRQSHRRLRLKATFQMQTIHGPLCRSSFLHVYRSDQQATQVQGRRFAL